jgi:Dihydrofolate reductase
MQLSLIVAMTRHGVIGRHGTLPWKLSADLKRFKALTMGHYVIMGRKTYASLPSTLPGRKLIVLKRLASPYDFQFSTEAGEELPASALSTTFASNLDEALHLASEDDEAFVIGGGEIFRQTIDRADRLYVTWVDADVDGDTTFPTFHPEDWQLIESSQHAADSRNEFPTTFCIYDRRRMEIHRF